MSGTGRTPEGMSENTGSNPSVEDIRRLAKEINRHSPGSYWSAYREAKERLGRAESTAARDHVSTPAATPAASAQFAGPVTIDANNAGHSKLTGQFEKVLEPEQDAKGKASLNRTSPPGLLERMSAEQTAGMIEFKLVAEMAYDEIQGDTVSDLLTVRDRMAGVIYGSNSAEFGFEMNQESSHPAVAEYQRVTLAALCNHAVTKSPTAASISISESDDELGVWGSVRVLDDKGDEVTEDEFGWNSYVDGEDGPTVDELVQTFGFRTLRLIEPDAVTVKTDKYEGATATIDLSKAPRSLRPLT